MGVDCGIAGAEHKIERLIVVLSTNEAPMTICGNAIPARQGLPMIRIPIITCYTRLEAIFSRI